MTMTTTSKKTIRTTTDDFDFHAAIVRAQQILSAPPTKPGIDRPERLLSRVVFRAALPANLCLEANKTSLRLMARAPWLHSKLGNALWAELEKQSASWLKYRWAWPVDIGLEYRPQVLSIKFSSHANDAGSNPGKKAIDMLTKRKLLDQEHQRYTKHRMGLISDDRRAVVEQLHWWEFQPRQFPAFVLIEVRRMPW
jgi:hypothetical protein